LWFDEKIENLRKLNYRIKKCTFWFDEKIHVPTEVLGFFSKIVFFWFRKTGGGHWMTGWDICRTLWFDEKTHVLTDMSITKMVSLNSSDSEKLVVVIDMFWNLPPIQELIHVLTEMSINLFIRSNTWILVWILNLFYKLCYLGLSKGFRANLLINLNFSKAMWTWSYTPKNNEWKIIGRH
jgi:hypothetical protein